MLICRCCLPPSLFSLVHSGTPPSSSSLFLFSTRCLLAHPLDLKPRICIPSTPETFLVDIHQPNIFFLTSRYTFEGQKQTCRNIYTRKENRFQECTEPDEYILTLSQCKEAAVAIGGPGTLVVEVLESTSKWLVTNPVHFVFLQTFANFCKLGSVASYVPLQFMLTSRMIYIWSAYPKKCIRNWNTIADISTFRRLIKLTGHTDVRLNRGTTNTTFTIMENQHQPNRNRASRAAVTMQRVARSARKVTGRRGATVPARGTHHGVNAISPGQRRGEPLEINQRDAFVVAFSKKETRIWRLLMQIV